MASFHAVPVEGIANRDREFLDEHGNPAVVALQPRRRSGVRIGGASSVSGVALRICSGDCAT